MHKRLLARLLASKTSDQEARRKGFILNILLLSVTLLTFVALVATMYHAVTEHPYRGASPIVMLSVWAFFVALYLLSKRGYQRAVSYVFVGLFFLISTYPLYVWGIQLPQGILAYAMVIVFAGILINARTAFGTTLLAAMTLGLFVHLRQTGVIVADESWKQESGQFVDVLIYTASFGIIALVSWLSNREITRSLSKARESEKALVAERNSLEVKVRERSKELEQLQMEKMLELHRFAEFGRLSAALLHDITNPLTAVSINLEQIKGKHHADLLEQARQGISQMEQYVLSARRQLQYQSEIKKFNIADEIQQVAALLTSKANVQQVRITLDLSENVSLHGDSTQFDHIISNLIANAIDAYDEIERDDKVVAIVARQKGSFAQIEVIDHGAGIPNDALKHIFEAFYTTKKHSRGTGIGLSIVKQTVETDFNGEVKVVSSKKTGTRFTLLLPLF